MSVQDICSFKEKTANVTRILEENLRRLTKQIAIFAVYGAIKLKLTIASLQQLP